MKTNRLFKIASALWLTITCLSIAMILVFLCTLDQIDTGIYFATHKYFKSWFLWVEVGNYSLPWFPAGLTIGSILLVNLVCAHFLHFRPKLSKIGIAFIHLGLVVLLLGSAVTAFMGQESQLRLKEGSVQNYSENFQQLELVILTAITPSKDRIISIPDSMLSSGHVISPDGLPFTIKTTAYYPNSELILDIQRTEGAKGFAKELRIKPLPLDKRTDRMNHGTAIIELTQGKTTLGHWVVSSLLNAFQPIDVNGVTYFIALRPTRFYTPYSIRLLDFTHDVYPGTAIPKNFASKVDIIDPTHHETQEAHIHMNHPLRYRGTTYFQASFAENDTVSIFQVVKNPSWLVPYISCGMIAFGLLFHFVWMLITRTSTRGNKS